MHHQEVRSAATSSARAASQEPRKAKETRKLLQREQQLARDINKCDIILSGEQRAAMRLSHAPVQLFQTPFFVQPMTATCEIVEFWLASPGHVPERFIASRNEALGLSEVILMAAKTDPLRKQQTIDLGEPIYVNRHNERVLIDTNLRRYSLSRSAAMEFASILCRESVAHLN